MKKWQSAYRLLMASAICQLAGMGLFVVGFKASTEAGSLNPLIYVGVLLMPVSVFVAWLGTGIVSDDVEELRGPARYGTVREVTDIHARSPRVLVVVDSTMYELACDGIEAPEEGMTIGFRARTGSGVMLEWWQEPVED